MIQLFLCYALLAVGSISAAPQFVDFSNGGIGVNFGGYSARAGLGGLLTGNAADGGLSASAGTPFGQRAAAGIGGSVNGQAAGGAYAGAQANDAVGASAVISGQTGPNQSGFLGAEAHNSGKTVQKTLIKESSIPQNVAPSYVEKTTVQKVKPPKKYVPVQTPSISSRFGDEVDQVHKNIALQQSVNNAPRNDYNPVVTKEVTVNPLQFLNIPIGILKVIQDSLQPIGYSKQVNIQTQG